MAVVSAGVLKSYFEGGDTPTCAQFVDLIDSTFTGELLANVASAAAAGSTGLINVTDASSASFEAAGSAGLVLVAASTQASLAATTARSGLIEIATTAEATAGTDATRAITPATLAIAGAGVWELIGTATASASASVDFTWAGTTYKKIMLVISGAKPVTDDVEAWIRTSTDGGLTFDSGAGNYAWNCQRSGMEPSPTFDDDGNNTATEIVMTTIAATEGVGNAADEFWSGIVEIYFPAQTAEYGQVNFRGNYLASINFAYAVYGSGYRLSAADIDGIRFLFESGNIASGEFACYGLK